MGQPGAGAVWAELSATLKALRAASGASLRQVETRSGVGRGTLSAVENGKAKPSRAIVEWYDQAFGGDGLPVSMYAEARSAHGRRRLGRRLVSGVCSAAHALRLEDGEPATGALVAAGAETRVRWRLRNAGTTAWIGRTVRRVGAPVAPALIASDLAQPLPDAAPGEVVDLEFTVRVPDEHGTFAAYWQLAHEDGEPCSAPGALLRLVVVVSALCPA